MARNGNKGKTALVDSKRALAKFLIEMQGGDHQAITWYLKKSLVKAKYVEEVPMKTAKKGRPRLELVVTGKGRGLIAMSKQWKVKDEESSSEESVSVAV